MDGDDHVSRDDDLDALLELADGPRGLPRGAEDRLLRSILQTASQPRVGELTSHDAQVLELATRRRTTVGRTVAAAVVLAVSVGVGLGAVTLTGRSTAPVGIDPLGTGDGLALDLEEAAGAELCDAIAVQVTRARLFADDVNVDRSDEQLPLDLAALLDELAVRASSESTDDDVDATTSSRLSSIAGASTALRLQAALLDGGDSAGAARARQRAAGLLRPLLPIDETIGCPPPTTDDRSAAG